MMWRGNTGGETGRILVDSYSISKLLTVKEAFEDKEFYDVLRGDAEETLNVAAKKALRHAYKL